VSVRLVKSVYSPGERHVRHCHDYTSVSVVLAGSLIEQVGRTEVFAGPLSVVVKPAGTEHADVFGPEGAVLIRLHVPSGWLTTLEDGSEVAGPWRWSRALPAARWLLRLATSSPDDPRGSDDAMAECLGTIAHDCEDLRQDAGTIPAWLLRVRDRIRDERGGMAAVTELARDAGVHPVYLTRRFRQVFGCSVTAYRQAERVRAAARAIGAQRAPLSDIAYATGFADQPHLTRAFRRVVGVTPSVYRQLSGQVGFVQDAARIRR
jgi:AraC-like DNA-binding protein